MRGDDAAMRGAFVFALDFDEGEGVVRDFESGGDGFGLTREVEGEGLVREKGELAFASDDA